jgi:hypothetical protein
MTVFSRAFRASWPPVLVFLCLVLGMMISGRMLKSQAYDQNLFHIQVVRQFEAEWPTPNLTEYGSATGPGYHLALTAIGKVVGSDLMTLRIVSMIFGVALICVVASLAAIVVGPRAAALLAMPMATSVYVIGSAMYVHTDNTAWLFALLVVGLLVFLRVTLVNLIAVALFAAIAVFIRQSFIWVVGPILFAGLITSPLMGRVLPSSGDNDRVRWGPFVGSILASIPAIVVLGVLVSLWGGLLQERFRAYHYSQFRLDSVGYAIAVFGIYTPFFLLSLPDIGTRFRQLCPWVVIAAIAGALATVIMPSVPSVESGRIGGPVWILAGIGPTIGDRSIMLALLAAVGGGFLVLLLGSAFARGRGAAAMIALCAWAAVTSTQLLNSQIFQRYFDTPALVLLIWLTALSLGGREDAETRSSFGPPLLAVVLAMLLVVRAIGF